MKIGKYKTTKGVKSVIVFNIADSQEFEDELKKQYNGIVDLDYTTKQVENRLNEINTSILDSMKYINKLWVLECAYRQELESTLKSKEVITGVRIDHPWSE